MTHKGFFAISRETFIASTILGINPAAVFLTLARGSGGDNVTTSWSAQAASSHLGIQWTSANAAITQLEKAKLIRRNKDAPRTRPRYTLAKKGNLIWLPNTLVDGVGDEKPPVTKMRETQDATALRLLVELYGDQNLREDGGISPKTIWQEYKRDRVGQHGQYVVWRFSSPTSWVRWSSAATAPHHIRLSDQEIDDGKSPGKEFFHRLDRLESLGLIEWVPYLFEGPVGEPIHPLHYSDLPLEQELYRVCIEAAERCLTERQYEETEDEGGLLAPIAAHIEQVTVIGIARLHYRPHTRLTAAWWVEQNARCQEFIERYNEIAAGPRLVSGTRDVA